MNPETLDRRIESALPLLAPADLARELPAGPELLGAVGGWRRQVEAVLAGVDDRLVVIVGPCSIHDPAAALDYAGRLLPVATRLRDDLLVVMRVYFEKPRTIAGWKGLINDPDLDGSFRINKGLRLARRLLLDIAALGLPAGTEFLDTTLGQYYAELIAWGAIGARTVESQVHRELASGLSMPVGFKNRTDGDVKVAVDALRSARLPHSFPSLTHEGAPAVLRTRGNDTVHLVLRGGSRGPNHDADSVASAVRRLREHNLPARVMVDCSHANSGKVPARQVDVADGLARRIASGERDVFALMIESHLEGGSQDPAAQPLAYGVSITDACLPWADTEPLLERLAAAVRERRSRPAHDAQ